MKIETVVQKTICQTLFTHLDETLSGIKYNTEYTCLTIKSSTEILNPDLSKRVIAILQTSGYVTYIPRRKEPNRIIALGRENFADIEIRMKQKNTSFEYNIYIYVSPTSAKYEWWFDEFMDQPRPKP